MDHPGKRYFKKRDHVELLHNPLSIPASATTSSMNIFWSVFNTLVYGFVIFCVVLQFPLFFPLPLPAASFADDLTDAPLSYRSHLLYLESLAVKNRLEEAQRESDFLLLSQKSFSPTPIEISDFQKLQSSISARKMVFHTTISEFNHWSAVLKEYPDYRDVLYVLAQRSYMLFDDTQTTELLKASVALDPQFEQGKKVLWMMGK
jgi:hypothetical protein